MPVSTGYIRHFEFCHRHDLSKFAPFFIAHKQLGWVTKELAALLPIETDLFHTYRDGLTLAPHLDNFSTRSDALATATNWIAARYGQYLRNEMYPVIQNWGDEPYAQIDRVAVPWFGVRGFGIHVNGFVRKKDGIHLWIGERAKDRLVDPGKLDNLIGGGQPIGLSLEDNLCKEAHEEAGIEAPLARTAKQVSTLTYMLEKMGGMRNDFLFIYDLELSEHFMPRNTDGEVGAFHLMPLPDIAKIIHDTDCFKFNCNIVIIDFMIRHGFLNAAHKEYQAITTYLKL